MTESIVILANGEFPTNDLPLGYLDSAKEVVCCDGAVLKLLEYGRQPSAIAGDLDSITESIKQDYSDRLYPDNNQESNDLTKAVLYCIERNYKEIIILGATGLREDHTIGNISLLAEYAEFINAKMITDNGIFIPLISSTRVSAWPGQQISIFSPDPELEISSEGLRYPLDKIKLKNWWKGTLNESIGDYFSLSFKEGKVIVFLNMIS